MALIRLASYSTIGEAEAARSALDAAGIDTYVADENLVAMNWMYSNAVGGVKLFVREEDLEQAERILAEAAAEPSAADDVAEVPEPEEEEEDELPHVLACPNCGSTDIARLPRLLLFGGLSVVIIGVSVAVHEPNLAIAGVLAVGLILLLTGSHYCRNCAHRWNASGPEEASAPPPEANDRGGMVCPRCGEPEVHPIRYRRLKAIPLLSALLMIVILPVWIFLPKKRCDHCGLRLWM